MTRADTNGDGVADQKDEKTLVKWQILKQDGDDLFFLADQALDCKKYNEKYTDVTWETCTLRSWLNSDFYDAAFSASEKTAIKQTDNPYYDTGGGNDTTDRLFLLSLLPLSEIVNTDYGFQSDRIFADQARHAKATDYAEAQGCDTNSEDESLWWLRSPGDNSDKATIVDIDGYVDNDGYDVYSSYGVRPALHLNLSSSVWKKGEIVTSEDKKTAITDTLPGEESDSGGNGGGGSDAGSSPRPDQTPAPIISASANPTADTSTVTSPAPTISTSANPTADTSTVTSPIPTNSSGLSAADSAAGDTTVGSKSSGSASSADTVTAPAKVKSLKVTNKKKWKTVLTYKKVSGKKKYGKWSAVKKLKKIYIPIFYQF